MVKMVGVKYSCKKSVSNFHLVSNDSFEGAISVYDKVYVFFDRMR